MAITTLEKIVESNVKLTPMMDQYYQIKKNFHDYLLMFRMGDFYELFFEDAEKASKILNITLTHRGKLGDLPIPMAGIPHHAASTYIDRLSSQNLKVAICEQIQDPKEAKGIVQRAVTQIVSPGMPYDLNKTDEKEEKNMVATFQEKDAYYIVSIDFTTGKFEGSVHSEKQSFLNQIKSYQPKELITFVGQWDHLKEIETMCSHFDILRTYLNQDYFLTKTTSLYIDKFIKNYKRDKTLANNQPLLNAIGALSYYICSTQNLDELFHIEPFKIKNVETHMKVSIETLQGLEILPSTRSSYNQSLLGYLDRCQSSLGSRRLKSLIMSPLLDSKEIIKRQNIIQYFVENHHTLQESREVLSQVRDLERILAKLGTNKATASDLINIERSIGAYFELKKLVDESAHQDLKFLDKKEEAELKQHAQMIRKTINDEIGASLDKGNLILEGVCKERDRLSKLSLKSSDHLAELEEKYRKETGINKLRVKRNNVAGYFIEVSKAQTNLIPDHFKRKQTLVNSERYLSDELSSLEKEITHAQFKLEAREREIFKELTSKLQQSSQLILKLSHFLSFIDALQALAWVSFQDQNVRPEISQTPLFQAQQMWHPLIKNTLGSHFVNHNIELNDKVRFGLITGPNMAGKTTVMREVAICQVLFQMGSFIPAKKAKLSLCDYLFSRLGAGDDILKGQSTFMMEMSETAEIIRHATEKSLIILDEVGRGTSTYDGLSIAWALIEDIIYNKKSLTLFATHYHELIEVIDNIEGAKNLTVKIKHDGQNVEFLYQLIESSASQSFGLYVAKLAGLPNSILYRAKEILDQLEVDSQTKEHKQTQLNLFESFEAETKTNPAKEAINRLKELEIDHLTPLEALNTLQELKSRLLSKE